MCVLVWFNKYAIHFINNHNSTLISLQLTVRSLHRILIFLCHWGQEAAVYLQNNFSQITTVTQVSVTLSLLTLSSAELIILICLLLVIRVLGFRCISQNLITSLEAFISSSSYFSFSWPYFLILLFLTICTMVGVFPQNQTIMSPEVWIWSFCFVSFFH